MVWSTAQEFASVRPHYQQRFLVDLLTSEVEDKFMQVHALIILAIPTLAILLLVFGLVMVKEQETYS